MTSPTPPVSDILRGIEGLASRSGEMLSEALNLIEQASRAEAAAMETAVAALGESHAKTVVDLARMPLAAETTRVLMAIRAAADKMLLQSSEQIQDAACSPSISLVDSQNRSSASNHQPDASGKVILFGLAVSVSRIAEAEEVVSAARTAVAQNRKANPYEHYRGKNSWCKSLFLAAFAQITSENSLRAPLSDASSSSHTGADAEDCAPSDVTTTTLMSERPSIAAAGPLRAAPQISAAQSAIPAVSRPSIGPASRLHAQGITAQTIEDPSKFSETLPQRNKPPARSFFNKQRVR